MIKQIINFSLKQRLATLLLVLAVVAIGLWAWFDIKKEAYPDVGDTEVVVITQFPGRAAEEVEQQITIPLERVLNGVPRVINRRSKTIFGLSVIQLVFEDGVDDYFARQRVLEKLNDAELPEGVQPQLGPLCGPVGEIFRYVIEADERYSPMELRTLQDWTIIPKILQVPGIADVINFGGLVKQFHVVTSPENLYQYGLTIQNVIDAVNNNNINTGGNIIKRGEQGFVIRQLGAIRTIDDIMNIVVTTQKGVPVFIKNLGTVEEFPLPPSGILGYTIIPDDTTQKIDVPYSIQGLIAMRRGENPSEVVDNIKAKIQEINENDLPEGVKLKVTYDRSFLVDNTIETVSRTLFEGFSIVIIVLVFFLGSLRSSLVVATTIPVSLLFAFLMMKITGIPANLLSLGAIDFGIIVDGAVVMVDNIIRHYREATEEQKNHGIIKLTYEAAHDVSKEIFFSISVIIIAYLPIFSFQRIEGKLFSPMAYTLAFAITGSLILALTAIPILMTFIYRKHIEEKTFRRIGRQNPVYTFMEKVYSKIIIFLTKHSLITMITSFLIVFIVGFIGWKSIGTEFLPDLDEGSINIRCFFPVGISLATANEYTGPIRKIIASHGPVNLVISQLGRNDDGTDPYGPNRMEILVGLKDYKKWTDTLSKKQLLLEIKNDMEQAVPGAKFSFSQPILDNVTEAVTGSVADLAILISGNDLDLMRLKADSILTIIKNVPGASEYGIEQEGNQAQLNIEIKREAAARFGINVSDLQKMIEAAIGGKKVSTLYDGSKRFDIAVRYSAEYRGSIEAVQDMLVTSTTGARIPMRELANISLKDGPTIIQREDGKRQISVRTNIRGRDQGSFVSEAQEKVNAAITLPKGYSIEWGGQFENLSRAGKRLAIVIPTTIVIILLLLFWLYKDFHHAMIAMSAIPYALIGGIAALLVRGYNFNVSSGVGFISLFGISIMSGVLYVSRTRKLIEKENIPLDQAVTKAAIIQLRPNLMAMLLALLGLIPASLASGIGSDVQRPLASVIVGGLTSAIFITTLALPPLYYFVETKLKYHKKEELDIDESK